MSSSLLKLTPARKPLDGEITLPGSKSYTNRALMIAALADGMSTLHGISHSRDSELMLGALKKLGVETEEHDGVLTVYGTAGKFLPFHGEINIGPAGTTMRFLTAICASIEGGEIILSGSERMHQRPIRDLVEALRTLGAEIDYCGTDGCPPLKIRGRRLNKCATIQIDCSKSSQYLSALLMLAPALQTPITFEVPREFVSQSYVAMTLETIRAFGGSVTQISPRTFMVSGNSPYRATTYQVESDLSGASYFWGLAALSGGRIRILNLNTNSLQGDIRFAELLGAMGCTVITGPDWIEVQGTPTLNAISADMELMPDTAQTLAVVASRAHGVTALRGLSTLRIKETDRLAALKAELAKVGIHSTISDDSIEIHGGNSHTAQIATYDDHRMAMAFSLLATQPDGITIEEPHVVEKSFPEFWDFLRMLGIVLT